MNYLAHVTLAEPTEAARLGALLGDFGRGLDVESLPADMRFALYEHRALDQWFDDHPRPAAPHSTHDIFLTVHKCTGTSV